MADFDAPQDPFAALLKVINALGFELQNDGPHQRIVQTSTGRKLYPVWLEDQAKDLKHFQGTDAVNDLATMLLMEVWAIAITGTSPFETQAKATADLHAFAKAGDVVDEDNKTPF